MESSPEREHRAALIACTTSILDNHDANINSFEIKYFSSNANLHVCVCVVHVRACIFLMRSNAVLMNTYALTHKHLQIAHRLLFTQ